MSKSKTIKFTNDQLNEIYYGVFYPNSEYRSDAATKRAIANELRKILARKTIAGMEFVMKQLGYTFVPTATAIQFIALREGRELCTCPNCAGTGKVIK